jgi:hypothetical protein
VWGRLVRRWNRSAPWRDRALLRWERYEPRLPWLGLLLAVFALPLAIGVGELDSADSLALTVGIAAGVASLFTAREVVAGFRRSAAPGDELTSMRQTIDREKRRDGYRLAGVDLRGARLAGSNLRGADLAGAQLERAELVGAQMRYADLTGARLNRANLTRAELRNTTLVEAHLDGTVLRDADLREAWLVGADLRRADLTSAKLEGALFAAADLRGARFQGDEFRGAYIEGARFDRGAEPRVVRRSS